MRAPRWSFACQTENAAPSGSVNTAIRPASMTSNGSVSMRPPAWRTFAAASSALCTHTYVFHTPVGGAPSGCDPTAATSPPRSRAMKYLPGAPGGITSSKSQPNRPLEVSGRTIRRDIERLRRLGYPVESLTGPGGGYRLRAGSAIPPLLLDDEEAIAIAVGLRTAARASVTGIEETAVRALVKLEQVLPAHLRRRVRALGSATVTSPAGGPTVDPHHLTVIASACRDSERLRFGYRSRDGTASRREVEPYSLLNRG